MRVNSSPTCAMKNRLVISMEEEDFSHEDGPKLPPDAQKGSDIFQRESIDGVLNRELGTFYALSEIRRELLPPSCTVEDILFMIESITSEGDFIEETFITFFVECRNLVRQEIGAEEEDDHEEDFELTEEFIADRLSDLQPVDDAHLSFNFASFLVQSAEIVKLDALSAFGALLNVSLKMNLVSDLRPLTKLPKLRTLDLTENKVRSLAGLHFPSLERLVLANNRLATLEPFDAPKLRELDVSNNKIFFISSFALANSPELEVLNLSQNSVKQFSQLCFGGLRKLRVLKLAENNFTSLKNALCKDLVAVQDLDLSDNQFIALEGMENLTSLLSLDVHKTGVEQVIDFAPMTDVCPVKKLFIFESPVADVDQVRLELIHILPTLEEIDEEPVTFAERQDSENMMKERAEEEARMYLEQLQALGEEEEEANPSEEVPGVYEAQAKDDD